MMGIGSGRAGSRPTCPGRWRSRCSGAGCAGVGSATIAGCAGVSSSAIAGRAGRTGRPAVSAMVARCHGRSTAAMITGDNRCSAGGRGAAGAGLVMCGLDVFLNLLLVLGVHDLLLGLGMFDRLRVSGALGGERCLHLSLMFRVYGSLFCLGMFDSVVVEVLVYLGLVRGVLIVNSLARRGIMIGLLLCGGFVLRSLVGEGSERKRSHQNRDTGCCLDRLHYFSHLNKLIRYVRILSALMEPLSGSVPAWTHTATGSSIIVGPPKYYIAVSPEPWTVSVEGRDPGGSRPCLVFTPYESWRCGRGLPPSLGSRPLPCRFVIRSTSYWCWAAAWATMSRES